MAVRTIRVAQTIDRELETRWFKLPWYLTRWEFCYAAVGTMVIALAIFIAGSDVASLTSFAILLPSGCYGMARWKKSNPEPSYIWDTFYRIGIIPERERWLKRRRQPVRFVPDIIPARSVFAGTANGGLALTEPWQTVGLPTFCPADDRGHALQPILPWRPLVSPRLKPQVKVLAAPAPAWFALADAPAWDDNTPDATRRLWRVKPTMCATIKLERIADV